MEFLHRAQPAVKSPARIGVLAGAFNPPTVAHMALAEAALTRVDEVVFVLPVAFPHKRYEGAAFEARVAMLRAAIVGQPAFSIATSQGGLFRDMARELRDVYACDLKLSFLCGRDAAERIICWEYGGETSLEEMLREFDLLVAARRGELEAPLHLRHAIERLYLPANLDFVSSTEVRERIARGEPWEHLVPEGVRPLAASIYR